MQHRAVVEDPSLVFNITNTAKWMVAGVAGFYVSLPGTVQLLLVLMAADFFTGLIVAYQQKALDAHRAWKGFHIKVLTLLLAAVAHLVSAPLNLPVDLGTIVAGAYAITELFSIVENCARAGVPIPEVLIQAMVKVRPKNVQGQAAVDQLEGATEMRVAVTEKTTGGVTTTKKIVEETTIKGSGELPGA